MAMVANVVGLWFEVILAFVLRFESFLLLFGVNHTLPLPYPIERRNAPLFLMLFVFPEPRGALLESHVHVACSAVS